MPFGPAGVGVALPGLVLRHSAQPDITASPAQLIGNDFIPAKFLTSDGWVVVDSELRAQSSDSSEKGAIYAIGDITNLPMRLLSRIADQVSVLVTNLKADIVGQGKHSQYSGNKMTMMVVPVGKSAGTGQFGSWVPWSFVVTMIKSKNFFIPMAPSFLSAK